MVDPNVHAWGAYDSERRLIRSGLATAGSSWCADIGRSCKTRGGSFRIYSLGSPYCKSSIYPLPNGGAPMPYCMFFNGNQGLHGSPMTWGVRIANLFCFSLYEILLRHLTRKSMVSKKEAKQEINPFDLLSDEILLHTFGFFNPGALINAKRVCKRFHRLSRDPFLQYYQFPLYDSCSWIFYREITALIQLSCGDLVSSSRSCSENAAIERWDIKEKKCIQWFEIKGQSFGGTNTFIGLSNDRLACGSDYAIKICDLQKGKCIQTFEQEEDEDPGIVSALVSLPNNRLASGSSNHLIKIWDLQEGECIQTLKGHQFGVNAIVSLSNDCLASGDDEGTIKIWDLKEKEKCIQTFRGHRLGIRTLVDLSNNCLASGSFDNTIKILDFKKGKCIRTLKDHQNWINALVKLPNDCLASGSFDNTIKIWNINSSHCIQTLKTSAGVHALTTLQDGRIVCGSNNGIETFLFPKIQPLKENEAILSPSLSM